MRKKKVRKKAIPIFTPFEKRMAKEVRTIISKENINPIGLAIIESSGEYRFRYQDVSNHYEMTGVPYDATDQDLVSLREADSYEARETLT